jgi:hypothetical protein
VAPVSAWTWCLGHRQGGGESRERTIIVECEPDNTLALRPPVQSNQQRFGNVSRLTPKLLAPPPSLTIVNGGRKRGGKYS